MYIPLDAANCRLVKSDGVKAAISQDKRKGSRAVRLDFEFSGAGHAIVRVPVSIKLPENYVFRFDVAGKSPVNTLEIKLLDQSTDNVWWVNRPNFTFTPEWQTLVNKTRHFSYAWGPNKDALSEVAFIDLTLTASSGGKGTIYFSDLNFDERPSPSASANAPAVWASSKRADCLRVLDGDDHSHWQSGLSERQSLVFTFEHVRELSALLLDWGDNHALNYQVEIKGERGGWRNTDTIIGASGGRQYLRLPDCDIKALRLVFRRSSAGKGYAVRSVRFMGLDYAPSVNDFWRKIARDYPKGFFPRYFDDEQSYWTVVGVSGGRQEAIINEEGLLEVGRQTASLEPFIFSGGELLTWKHGKHAQRLEDGYLPIAIVEREHDKFALEVKTFAVGPREDSTLYARYRIKNLTGVSQQGKFFLAIRQFQVNPPWQFLNQPGGFTNLTSFTYAGDTVYVNEGLRLRTLSRPDGFGATSLASGDVVEHLNYGLLPEYGGLVDTRGFGSGALMYAFELAAHGEATFDIAVPYTTKSALQEAGDALQQAKRFWHNKLDNVGIDIPAAPELTDTVRSQLAYILVNRDGPGIQPGSRCYRRTWIRDGSLTSAALLQHGFVSEAREFIDWFAPHQYPNGKVPCCVDKRGADPTPEHDSHGEFIYLVMEYYRYTGDKAFLRGIFPRVLAAASYIDELRQQCMTDAFKAPEHAHLYGILPPSISHEGYSAHPAHSNWDNLFAMKGLDDAVAAAEILADEVSERDRQWLNSLRDEFHRDFLASVRASMSVHNIDYIPGAADLGDLDPTSTTIGLDPCAIFAEMPAEVKATFERYWKFFQQRRDGEIEWDAYTPYEWRSVGTFVRLGEVEKAHAAIDYFMGHRRPRHWNHWGEVIYRDPLATRFIGDAPHGWVGSDFLRSIRNLFVYEEGGSLVVGAGIKSEWLEQGVSINNLPTHFGSISLAARRSEKSNQNSVVYEISGNARRVALKIPDNATSVTLNGMTAVVVDSMVRVSSLPAVIKVGFAATS
jgi:hypothetical protein